MGYTTDFDGRFDLDKPLTPEQAAYLREFSSTRRMARDVTKMRDYTDPLRDAVGLPLGVEGEFFVGAGDSNPNRIRSGDFLEWCGQTRTPDIIDYNSGPSTQPGLWCQWEPSEDNQGIEWDGAEKFYDYTEWLRYIIENFLKPWKLKLNGTVNWVGEDRNDRGCIVVKNNKVSVMEGHVSYKKVTNR